MTYDVIIIGGGGLSALVAAHELAQFGAKICLLEARGRLGGQIYTVQDKHKFPIDLGAMYVHGQGTPENINPLFSMIERLHIESIEVDSLNSDLRNTKGLPLSMVELFSTLQPEINAAIFTIQEAKKIAFLRSDPPPSLAEVLDYRKDNEPPKDSKHYWVRKWITATLTHHTGAPLQDLSLLNLMHGRIFPGKPRFIIGGTHLLAARLWEETASTHNITTHFHSAVTSVKRNTKDNSFQVVTEDKRSLNSKSVLCAVPLSLLKKNTIQFVPNLSSSKKQALQCLKMGQINKIWLEFKSPFWPADVHYLYPNDPDIRFWPEYFNLYHFSKHKTPSLLTGFYAEKALFKKQNDTELLEVALKPLRRAYPTGDFTLTDWKVSHWDNYGYSLGSGTYCGAHTTEEKLRPIEVDDNNGLFFANDYMSYKRGLQGTLEGAFDAGMEAALDIAVYLRHRLQQKPFLRHSRHI